MGKVKVLIINYRRYSPKLKMCSLALKFAEDSLSPPKNRNYRFLIHLLQLCLLYASPANCKITLWLWVLCQHDQPLFYKWSDSCGSKRNDWFQNKFEDLIVPYAWQFSIPVTFQGIEELNRAAQILPTALDSLSRCELPVAAVAAIAYFMKIPICDVLISWFTLQKFT